MFKVRLFVVFYVGFAIVSCSSAQKTPGVSQAPDFKLQTLQGDSVTLSEYQNKIVLVHFWASWCYSCVYELATLNNLRGFLKDKDFEILAIAIDDDWPSIKQVQAEHKYDLPLLFDVTGDVRNAYKVQGLPQTFLVGKDGKLLEFLEPDSGNLVTHTTGPQRWDEKSTADYISKLTDQG